MPHVIEILHFAGCPNVEKARAVVEAAVAEASSTNPVEVHIVEVTDEDEAARLRFLGSPTIRVDRRDVDPWSFGRTDFGLQCRTYTTENGIAPCPPVEWITRLLRVAETV